MKLVDSSAWVEYLRSNGNRNVKYMVESLLQADRAAYTCPIRFELLCGVRPSEENDLEQAFAFSHHYPFELNDWPKAALLQRQLQGSGLNIPRIDLFVATVAIRTGLVVLCRDAHFSAAQNVVGAKLRVEQV